MGNVRIMLNSNYRLSKAQSMESVAQQNRIQQQYNREIARHIEKTRNNFRITKNTQSETQGSTKRPANNSEHVGG